MELRRVVVTGASGNLGTAVVERLAASGAVGSVTGICRREHAWRPDGVAWAFVDVARDALTPYLEGADAVVHLAWLFQPMRRPDTTWRTNVEGTLRLLEAVERTGVPRLVVASSVGAYSPRRDLEPVDESWPTHGSPTTAYAREKAYVERLLDVHEERFPDRRVVRLRPGFVFSPRASVEQRRLFLGPLVPEALLRAGRVPLLPLPRDLRLQTVHADDVAAAVEAALTRDVRGAVNLAADPVLAPGDLADLLHARTVPVPAQAVRRALGSAYRLRAVPAAPEAFDMLMSLPVMDTARARAELGWRPQHDARAALQAFLAGQGSSPEPATPPLARATSGPLRAHEAATGVGARP